jgi:hypothetical protein
LIKHTFSMMFSLARKRCLTLFPHQTTGTQLINLLNLRQTFHQLLLSECPECPEIEMPKAHMPELSALSSLHHQIYWLCNLHAQHIEPIL